MSLSGSKGTRAGTPACSLSSFLSLRNNIGSSLSTLCGLAVHNNRRLVLVDKVIGDDNLLDVRLGRHVVHKFTHDVFHDREQPTLLGFSLHGFSGNGSKRLFSKL